jgi:hypothetical protein
MDGDASMDFHRAMIAIYQVAKRDVGYNATRFLQMVSEHGGLGAARSSTLRLYRGVSRRSGLRIGSI